MKTRHSWWFLGGKYDEAVFETDLQKILDEYGNHGRLEAQIADTQIQAEGKGLNITVKLAEGPEYRVETQETAGNYVFDNDEVGKLVKTKPGEVHNRGQVEADASIIEQGYRDSGYVSARVTPQVTLDREKKTTHIVDRVNEGDLKYIEEIKVSGNTVTKDEVIRRELMVKPGERFDGPAIRASQNRLDNTKYFDKIRLTLEDPDESDPFANLLVDVEEAKTGEFTFGGGYSTEEGLGGYAQLRLNNFDISNWPTFSGGGQQFSARISLGEVRNEYSLSFTDPEFLGYPLIFGADVFDESYEYREGADFTEHTSGAQIRFGKNLSPYVTARTSLRYRDIDISDIPWYAAPELSRERGGSSTISSIWGINRNTLDIRYDPTAGSRHDLQVEIAGLGGDNEFVKVEHDSAWYFSLSENKKWILSYRTREGWASEYGSSDFVPINDRFFVGGTTTVRGYDAQDIGPKVRRYRFWGDKEAIGGDARLVENLELKYKLTDKFRLYTFVDAGGAWRDAGDFDMGDIKVGTGIGIGVDVPHLGPIRLDYGFPINPDEDQGSGRLHFTTTTRF
jgi:outer membrane protein insertion porin family